MSACGVVMRVVGAWGLLAVLGCSNSTEASGRDSDGGGFAGVEEGARSSGSGRENGGEGEEAAGRVGTESQERGGSGGAKAGAGEGGANPAEGGATGEAGEMLGEGGGTLVEGGAGQGGSSPSEGGLVSQVGGVSGEGGVVGESGSSSESGEENQGGIAEAGQSGGTSTTNDRFGEPAQGQFHLGPVDFAETEWHNACAPGEGYRAELQASIGLGDELLAGVSSERMAGGDVCDICIAIQTDTGRSLVARVVTYGESNTPGDLDVSPTAYAILDDGTYPRSMVWQMAKCPDTGPIVLEFQTEANPWWTSLWVRNARVPLASVEVKSTNHSEYFELRRESDGTLNDDGGFGEGAFTLRLTGVDGQILEQSLDGFEPGSLVETSIQFE